MMAQQSRAPSLLPRRGGLAVSPPVVICVIAAVVLWSSTPQSLIGAVSASSSGSSSNATNPSAPSSAAADPSASSNYFASSSSSTSPMASSSGPGPGTSNSRPATTDIGSGSGNETSTSSGSSLGSGETRVPPPPPIVYTPAPFVPEPPVDAETPVPYAPYNTPAPGGDGTNNQNQTGGGGGGVNVPTLLPGGDVAGAGRRQAQDDGTKLSTVTFGEMLERRQVLLSRWYVVMLCFLSVTVFCGLLSYAKDFIERNPKTQVFLLYRVVSRNLTVVGLACAVSNAVASGVADASSEWGYIAYWSYVTLTVSVIIMLVKMSVTMHRTTSKVYWYAEWEQHHSSTEGSVEPLINTVNAARVVFHHQLQFLYPEQDILFGEPIKISRYLESHMTEMLLALITFNWKNWAALGVFVFLNAARQGAVKSSGSEGLSEPGGGKDADVTFKMKEDDSTSFVFALGYLPMLAFLIVHVLLTRSINRYFVHAKHEVIELQEEQEREAHERAIRKNCEVLLVMEIAQAVERKEELTETRMGILRNNALKKYRPTDDEVALERRNHKAMKPNDFADVFDFLPLRRPRFAFMVFRGCVLVNTLYLAFFFTGMSGMVLTELPYGPAFFILSLLPSVVVLYFLPYSAILLSVASTLGPHINEKAVQSYVRVNPDTEALPSVQAKRLRVKNLVEKSGLDFQALTTFGALERADKKYDPSQQKTGGGGAVSSVSMVGLSPQEQQRLTKILDFAQTAGAAEHKSKGEDDDAEEDEEEKGGGGGGGDVLQNLFRQDAVVDTLLKSSAPPPVLLSDLQLSYHRYLQSSACQSRFLDTDATTATTPTGHNNTATTIRGGGRGTTSRADDDDDHRVGNLQRKSSNPLLRLPPASTVTGAVGGGSGKKEGGTAGKQPAAEVGGGELKEEERREVEELLQDMSSRMADKTKHSQSFAAETDSLTPAWLPFEPLPSAAGHPESEFTSKELEGQRVIGYRDDGTPKIHPDDLKELRRRRQSRLKHANLPDSDIKKLYVLNGKKVRDETDKLHQQESLLGDRVRQVADYRRDLTRKFSTLTESLQRRPDLSQEWAEKAKDIASIQAVVQQASETQQAKSLEEKIVRKKEKDVRRMLRQRRREVTGRDYYLQFTSSSSSACSSAVSSDGEDNLLFDADDTGGKRLGVFGGGGRHNLHPKKKGGSKPASGLASVLDRAEGLAIQRMRRQAQAESLFKTMTDASASSLGGAKPSTNPLDVETDLQRILPIPYRRIPQQVPGDDPHARHMARALTLSSRITVDPEDERRKAERRGRREVREAERTRRREEKARALQDKLEHEHRQRMAQLEAEALKLENVSHNANEENTTNTAVDERGDAGGGGAATASLLSSGADTSLQTATGGGTTSLLGADTAIATTTSDHNPTSTDAAAVGDATPEQRPPLTSSSILSAASAAGTGGGGGGGVDLVRPSLPTDVTAGDVSSVEISSVDTPSTVSSDETSDGMGGRRRREGQQQRDFRRKQRAVLLLAKKQRQAETITAFEQESKNRAAKLVAESTFDEGDGEDDIGLWVAGVEAQKREREKEQLQQQQQQGGGSE